MVSYLLLGIALLVGYSYAEVTCNYNGKTYKQGEEIPTPDQPCFKCSCFDGWTKPDIVHCALIECPSNFFRLKGCTPRHVEGKCCPEWDCPERKKREVAEVTCDYNGKSYKLGEEIPTPDQPCYVHCKCFEGWTKPDHRHCALVECPWDYYREKGCTPEYVEGKCCPQWNCPERNKREDVVCSYNGVEYLKGESIPTPDKPCYKCHCHEGWTGPSATHCALVDCPYDPNQKLGCQPVYTKGKCCPKWECPSGIASPAKRVTEVTCDYNGKSYKLGEEIPTPDQPCYVHCKCFEGWTKPDHRHCALVECPWDYYREKGCTPEYVEGKCCPKWTCPERNKREDIPVCEYKGMRYLIGDRIPTPEHPCLVCQCFDGWTEPNSFDCAVVDCPNDPIENHGCKPIYEKDKCCPKWECPPK